LFKKAGLISAYDLSGDDIFLKKAEELGDSIIRNYDENHLTSIPINHICLARKNEAENYMSRLTEMKKDLGICVYI
jgi:uncharacterized protein YyaL (SSP411 family)